IRVSCLRILRFRRRSPEAIPSVDDINSIFRIHGPISDGLDTLEQILGCLLGTGASEAVFSLSILLCAVLAMHFVYYFTLNLEVSIFDNLDNKIQMIYKLGLLVFNANITVPHSFNSPGGGGGGGGGISIVFLIIV
ncbi:hypothetical protein ACJX0J_014559, partial [Zea mays]